MRSPGDRTTLLISWGICVLFVPSKQLLNEALEFSKWGLSKLGTVCVPFVEEEKMSFESAMELDYKPKDEQDAH